MNGLYRPTKERDRIVHVCSFLSLLNCRRFTFEAEHLYDEKRMGYVAETTHAIMLAPLVLLVVLPTIAAMCGPVLTRRQIGLERLASNNGRGAQGRSQDHRSANAGME